MMNVFVHVEHRFLRIVSIQPGLIQSHCLHSSTHATLHAPYPDENVNADQYGKTVCNLSRWPGPCSSASSVLAPRAWLYILMPTPSSMLRRTTTSFNCSQTHSSVHSLRCVPGVRLVRETGFAHKRSPEYNQIYMSIMRRHKPC